ncbi:hypothetical protein QVD17_15895 [Tagetes erecta]|uniref:EF-hand domain-containing protein n=1 Tax=Tagetes erecta TaxID=13708 RepID=A0AAD8KVS0_TARER|nr:hypothetical protein QVD17_15895 [Tagetes erecta]
MAAGMIFMDLKYFAMLYLFVEWVILLHDCYSLWGRHVWRFIFAAQTTTCAARVQPQRVRPQNGCNKLLGVDVKMIMDRLGMLWDCDDNKTRVIGSEEMLGLFDVEEPSLDEVKEAFSVFDRNKDGYIDENELKDVLSEMGWGRISGSDCRRMIDRYDVDKDEKISFREFLKLMEDSFQ